MEVVSLEQMEMKQGNDYEENQQQQKQKQKQLQLQQQQHFHVLAVDDSLIDRKLLEKLLTISSYHVTCVESGDKALEYLGLLDGRDNDTTSSSSPSPSFSSSSSSFSSSSSANSTQQEMQGLKVNLIMTDYCMPGMSGYDLLKRVKGSSWKDVPVVVMSSENVPSRINMCLEGGAEDFLLKPVQLSDLKKLQPHLLKSLSQYPCENISSSSTNEDDESINKNNNSSCSSCSSSKISNYGVCKRKALVSADPLERRSKLKD